MNTLAYTIGENLYLNITNSCTNDCEFCIRNKPKAFNEEFDLWLDHEPTAEEIIEAIKDPEKYKEIVFCGYGEPLIRLEIIKKVATLLKEKNCRVRIDSNGTGNLIHKRNIAPELAGLIDSISISLNAHNAELYEKICRPQFGAQTFQAVLDFAKSCKGNIPDINLTIVDTPNTDIEQCQKLADEIGVKLKIRKYYEEDYAGFKE